VLRLDPQPPALDQVEQRVLIVRKAEEPVALDDPLRRRPVLRAASVDEVGGVDERLAAGAVQAHVVALVEVAALRACSPETLDTRPVTRVGARADEVVVRELERCRERGEAVGLLGDELRNRHAGGRRSLHVLERVVVGPAEEPDGVAAQPSVPGEHVRLHELERVAEMGIAVRVRDGGGDIEAVGAHRVLLAGVARPAPMSVPAPLERWAGCSTQGARARREALATGPSSESAARARTCPQLTGGRR
jgi:hypothetical protein